MTDVLARLRELQAGDLPVHGGRTLAYVYDSGLAEVDEIGRAAVAAYAGSNGLTRRRSPRCCRWRTSWSASRAACSTHPRVRWAR